MPNSWYSSWLLFDGLWLCCSCVSLALDDGERYCEWNRNGLGIDYQVLAGPSFIAVYTVVGVFLGIAADKHRRYVFQTERPTLLILLRVSYIISFESSRAESIESYAFTC